MCRLLSWSTRSYPPRSYRSYRTKENVLHKSWCRYHPHRHNASNAAWEAFYVLVTTVPRDCTMPRPTGSAIGPDGISSLSDRGATGFAPRSPDSIVEEPCLSPAPPPVLYTCRERFLSAHPPSSIPDGWFGKGDRSGPASRNGLASRSRICREIPRRWLFSRHTDNWTIRNAPTRR